jgi:UDP-N-acetylglucosamine 3-dehydrogenase
VSAKLKAGVIGFGSMGKNHVRVLRALDGVDLIGIVDPVVQSDRDELLKSLKELLLRKPDYCVVATPTLFHEEVALELAQAGVHALVEKPIAPSVDSGNRMADAFEQNNLTGAVGHIERYNPALREAKRRMGENQIGKVIQVATRRQGPFPGRISDIGVVKDLATHDIDLTRWILGTEYKSVNAYTAIKSGRDNEDLLAALCLLQDGTIVSHLVNWLSPLKERTVNIIGEKGAFTVDTLLGDLIFHANAEIENQWDDVAHFRGVREGDMIRYAFPKNEPLRTEHEKFKEAIEDRGNDIITLRDAIQTLETAEKMIRSSMMNSSENENE